MGVVRYTAHEVMTGHDREDVIGMRRVLTRCGVLAGVSALTLGLAPGVLAAVGDQGEAGGTIVEDYGDGTYLEVSAGDAIVPYADAASGAEGYSSYGYDDWSMPTAEQMGKVVEANDAGDLGSALKNYDVYNMPYWTSTEYSIAGYRQVCAVGTSDDCTGYTKVWRDEKDSAFVRYVRVGGTLIVVSTAAATSTSSAAPQLMNVELIDDESTVLQGELPYGTWLAVLTSVDTENLTGRSTPDGHDLLGWSTDKNFPVDIAQRQVDNNWGAYETHNDDGRITSVFIPVGHHANITSDTQLHAIWSTPTTTDAAPTPVNSQVTD